MLEIPENLQSVLRQFGQEHVLAWWPALTLNQRHLLLEQLRSVNLPQLHELFQNRDRTWQLPPLHTIQPVTPADLAADAERWGQIGAAALERGEVAALVVAGGQGSRLGATLPKGMFAVGPISGKSLFQIHAEKVLALRRRYNASVPFLVMTSPATDHKTREFFAEHGFFGLPLHEVHFFCQGTMPALDAATGKLLLTAREHLSLSPNGHGGTLLALRDSGLLARLRSAGIRHIYYFQVDNPLGQLADPAFLGHHCASQCELSIKALPKSSPDDKLGNIVAIDGRCHIIEYSDLPKALAESRDDQGRLRFALGSPAIHIFDTDFLDRVLRDAASLPFHLARKKVPYLNDQGERVEPREPNAFKFEMFIFDIFPKAERWSVVPTTRDTEFAPLKNETGPDSPETVRQAISQLAADWLWQAGARLPGAGEAFHLEISPLFALDLEELKAKIAPGFQIDGPTYLH